MAARGARAAGRRVRRIGVLMPNDDNDPEQKRRLSAFTQALAELGWTIGRNVRMEVRRYGADINRMRALVQELVGLRPDIIVTGSIPATVALQWETRTIPIVYAGGGDPVASGIVATAFSTESESRGIAMPQSYSGDLRERVIGTVEAGASRREAAESFEISVSSAIRWVQRWREEGSSEPKPRGGSRSVLEDYAERILSSGCRASRLDPE
jgi:transposase-like protein